MGTIHQFNISYTIILANGVQAFYVHNCFEFSLSNVNISQKWTVLSPTIILQIPHMSFLDMICFPSLFMTCLSFVCQSHFSTTEGLHACQFIKLLSHQVG